MYKIHHFFMFLPTFVYLMPFSRSRIFVGMGIDGLTQCMQETKVLTGLLSSLPRSVKIDGGHPTCVLAWDLSGSLYPPLRTEGADAYWSIPARPISAVTTHLDRIIKIFTESNVELIAVTDGCDHPHKLETKVRGVR